MIAADSIIVLFDSIHHVLAAERTLIGRNVRCDLVPVPKELAADCGMALVLGSADREVAREILAEPRFRARGAYSGARPHAPMDL